MANKKKTGNKKQANKNETAKTAITTPSESNDATNNNNTTTSSNNTSNNDYKVGDISALFGQKGINSEQVFGTKAQLVKPKQTVEASTIEKEESKKRKREETVEAALDNRDIKKMRKQKLDQKRIAKKADSSQRTLFLGNFPIAEKKVKKMQKQIKSLFEKYGKVETIRIRNLAVRDFKSQNRKLAVVNNMMDTKQKPFANAYVVFAIPGSEKKKEQQQKNEESEEGSKIVESEQEKTSNEEATTTTPENATTTTGEGEETEEQEQTATPEQLSLLREQMDKAVKDLNASVFEGRHLVVDFVTNYDGSFTEHKQLTKRDHVKSVFLGNLPFDVDDEEIWDLFEKKMKLKVAKVRVVRDTETQRGKGFGFVQLQDEDDATLAATKSEHFSIRDKYIRITNSSPNAMKFKEAKKKKDEAKKERAKKQSHKDKELKKPEVANALLQSLEDPSNPQSNPYSGLRADKKQYLERQEKQKTLRHRIAKQNKQKHTKGSAKKTQQKKK